jgi:hypothetical protein
METIDQMTKNFQAIFKKTFGLPGQNLVTNFQSPQLVTKIFESPNLATKWLATKNW